MCFVIKEKDFSLYALSNWKEMHVRMSMDAVVVVAVVVVVVAFVVDVVVVVILVVVVIAALVFIDFLSHSAASP